MLQDQNSPMLQDHAQNEVILIVWHTWLPSDGPPRSRSRRSRSQSRYRTRPACSRASERRRRHHRSERRTLLRQFRRTPSWYW